MWSRRGLPAQELSLENSASTARARTYIVSIVTDALSERFQRKWFCMGLTDRRLITDLHPEPSIAIAFDHLTERISGADTCAGNFPKPSCAIDGGDPNPHHH